MSQPLKYANLRRGKGWNDAYNKEIWGEHWPDLKREFTQFLSYATAIDISPINDYIDAEGTEIQEEKTLPAWPYMWVEVTAQVRADVPDGFPVDPQHYGLLVAFSSPEPRDNTYLMQIYSVMFPSIGACFCGVSRTVVSSDGIVETKDRDYISTAMIPESYVLYGITPYGAADMMRDVLYTQRLLAFLHAKNIVQVDKPFMLPPRKGRRTRHPTGYRYKELRVVKPGQTSTGGSRSAPGEPLMAAHLVRGHLAHYTEKGMFGKYFGTFYIPSHVRGNKANGVIVKDYIAEARTDA